MEYLVVCDVNVYIDAVEYLAESGGFPALEPPGQVNARRTAAMVFGWFRNPPSGVDVHLYSDERLDQIVVYKLITPRPNGLGWTEYQANKWFAQTLIPSLDESGRSFQVVPAADATYLDGADHEDERVYGLFKSAQDRDTVRTPILVSRDRAFVEQVNADSPASWDNGQIWYAMSPTRFCELMCGAAPLD